MALASDSDSCEVVGSARQDPDVAHVSTPEPFVPLSESRDPGSAFGKHLDELLVESERAAFNPLDDDDWGELGPHAEDAWYDDARCDENDSQVAASSEWSLVDSQEAAPRALRSPLDERDVQRVAAELERRQAGESVPKQAWQVPGLLSYPWETKRPLRLV